MILILTLFNLDDTNEEVAFDYFAGFYDKTMTLMTPRKVEASVINLHNAHQYRTNEYQLEEGTEIIYLVINLKIGATCMVGDPHGFNNMSIDNGKVGGNSIEPTPTEPQGILEDNSEVIVFDELDLMMDVARQSFKKKNKLTKKKVANINKYYKDLKHLYDTKLVGESK